MLVLLYALCCTAVFGTATYYVIYRTALLQRVLAAALRKGLRRLLYSTKGDEELDLVYTDSGMCDLTARHTSLRDVCKAQNQFV